MSVSELPHMPRPYEPRLWNGNEAWAGKELRSSDSVASITGAEHGSCGELTSCLRVVVSRAVDGASPGCLY